MTQTAETPTDSPDLAPEDPRSIYAGAIRTARAALEQLTDNTLTQPTPCDDFDVRAMAGHLVSTVARVAALGRGEDMFDVPGITERADDDWVAALDDAAAAAHDAFADASTLDAMYHLPWASMPGFALMITYTNEVTVHTWDVAKGAGIATDIEWDDRVVRAAYEGIQIGLPADGRREAFEEALANMPDEIAQVSQMPFDEVQSTAPDAPLIDRLVAWNGRRPDWEADQPGA